MQPLRLQAMLCRLVPTPPRANGNGHARRRLGTRNASRDPLVLPVLPVDNASVAPHRPPTARVVDGCGGEGTVGPGLGHSPGLAMHCLPLQVGRRDNPLAAHAFPRACRRLSTRTGVVR